MVDASLAENSLIACHKTLDGERPCARRFCKCHRDTRSAAASDWRPAMIDVDAD